MSFKRINNRGDTMIEVVVAIVVLTLILGAAYAITSSGLKSARRAQERGEALKIAESQIENIKSKAAAGEEAIFTTPAFCFTQAGAISTDDCTFTGLYRVSIASSATPPTRQFVVTVLWDSFGRAGVDQVVMTYRVIDETP